MPGRYGARKRSGTVRNRVVSIGVRSPMVAITDRFGRHRLIDTKREALARRHRGNGSCFVHERAGDVNRLTSWTPERFPEILRRQDQTLTAAAAVARHGGNGSPRLKHDPGPYQGTSPNKRDREFRATAGGRILRLGYEITTGDERRREPRRGQRLAAARRWASRRARDPAGKVEAAANELSEGPDRRTQTGSTIGVRALPKGPRQQRNGTGAPTAIDSWRVGGVF